MVRCCKTCEYLDVRLNASNRRVVYADKVYPCVAPTAPAEAAIRLLVTEGNVKSTIKAATRKPRMTGDEGKTCMVYKPYRRV